MPVKWETGKSMPDSSIMLELCEILGITVNELLSGEEINMENLKKKADENLIALKRKECAWVNFFSFRHLAINFPISIWFITFSPFVLDDTRNHRFFTRTNS